MGSEHYLEKACRIIGQGAGNGLLRPWCRCNYYSHVMTILAIAHPRRERTQIAAEGLFPRGKGRGPQRRFACNAADEEGSSASWGASVCDFAHISHRR